MVMKGMRKGMWWYWETLNGLDIVSESAYIFGLLLWVWYLYDYD